MNEKMAKGLGMAIHGLVKAGVYDFATFVKHAVEALGLDIVRDYGEHFQNMWDEIGEGKGVMQPSRPVADILKEMEDMTNQQFDENGTLDCGHEETSTMESEEAFECMWWSPGMPCFAVKAKPGEQIEWETWKDRLKERLREMLKDQEGEQALETAWLDKYGACPHWPRGKPEKVVDSMEFEQQLILHGIEPEKFPMTVEAEWMLPGEEIVTDVGFWMDEVILPIAD